MRISSDRWRSVDRRGRAGRAVPRWRSGISKALAAVTLVVSGVVAPVVDAPSAHATPDLNHLHDLTQWAEWYVSSPSYWLDTSSGLNYGVYRTGVMWQGKSTTPLVTPSVGDVFYVHVYTEVSNVWTASYRLRVLLPAGLQLVTPSAANDVLCEITNLSNQEIRPMAFGECAAPVMFGGYAQFPYVQSGTNEKIHYWFPVTATQPMTQAAMQVLTDQANAPAVSLPNPTLVTTYISVVAAGATVPAAPTGLSATPGNGSATVSFTAGSNGGAAITNHEYSLNNGVSWTAFSPADTASPVTIGGLTNGATYSVRLRAVNSVGAGTASAAVSVTPAAPVTAPAAPTSLSASPGNGSATISFTAGSNGGSAITNHQYSLNGGATWTSLSPADTASPVAITGLTNGTTYNVHLRAVNAVGSGTASSAVSVTPRTTPTAPTGLSATPGNGSATISFTAGSNGGSAITNHEYSLNGGATWTSLSPADTASPVTITGLTNGTTYNVQLRAVNAAGAGAASAAVPVTPAQPAAPVTAPAAPTGLSATTGNGSATISFTAGSNGGSSITNYQYSVDDGSTWAAFSPADVTSPVTITGLTNGTFYKVKLRAVNAVGVGAPSLAVGATPVATVPAAPSGLAAAPGNLSATIRFTPGSNGGSAITNHQYSLNGGAWTALSPADASTPVTITGLTNGVTYGVRLRAVNAVGAGPASAQVSVVPSTVPPAAPSRLTASPRNGAARIAFVPGSNGGAAITNYQYSVNLGAWKSFSPADAASPVVVPGLRNGVLYSIRLRALNAKGAGAASAAVSVRPSATPVVPGAPRYLTATSGSTGTTAVVSFWPGSDGGAAITNYQYSVNLGAWKSLSPADAASPVTVPGLAKGTTSSIRLRALNVKGAGPASAAVSVTTANVPAAPTALVQTSGGSGSVGISFTRGASNGSTITNHQYSVDGGPWTSFSPAVTGTTATVPVAGVGPFSIRLRAVNGVGPGAASAPLGGAGPPSGPTNVTVGSNIQFIGFDPITFGPLFARYPYAFWLTPSTDGGAPITGYTARWWTAESGGSVAFSCSTTFELNCQSSSASIAGVRYWVEVVATNQYGTSAAGTRVPWDAT